MNPIEFHCSQNISASAAVICAQIADTTRWSEFSGYGILPGVKSATYEKRTDAMVGSRIHVYNTDGSEHVEEISTWVAGSEIEMRLQEFTPPLSNLATHITEDWSFQATATGTLVTRTIRMYPRRSLIRPVLWLISRLFRQAIVQNLKEMAAMR
jgi:hypothetical protein